MELPPPPDPHHQALPPVLGTEGSIVVEPGPVIRRPVSALWFMGLLMMLGLFFGSIIETASNQSGGVLKGFVIAAPLSSAICAWFFWKFLIARSESTGLIRGGLVGIFTGVSSHILCWYIFFLLNYFIFNGASNKALAGIGNSQSFFNGGTIDPIGAFYASLFFSFWSLLILGWVTIPFAVFSALILQVKAKYF